jgi:tetratricopeptide (TPR) repeat protein
MAQRSVDIRVRELGPEHELTTRLLETIATIDALLGNYDRALEAFSRLLSVRTRVLHPHNILLSSTYAKLGNAQRLAGFSDRAEQTLRQAIDHEARTRTGENLVTGFALALLGEIHNRRGLRRQALIECRRALKILSRHLGPESSRLIDARVCLGEALIAAGDFKAARDELERGLASVGDEDENPRSTAGARFQLARALWATPADRPRARDLARATLSALAAAEGDNRDLMARIKKWISTRGDTPDR